MNAKHLVAAFSVLLIVGCGLKETDCGSRETKRLVGDIIRENDMLMQSPTYVALLMKSSYQAVEMSAEIKKIHAQLDKLQKDRSSIYTKIDKAREQCAVNARQSPEMTTARRDIEQLTAQVKDLERKKAQQYPPDAFQHWLLNGDRAELEKKKRQYDNDQANLARQIGAMNRKLQYMRAMYKSSDEFIQQACFHDARDNFRAYPPLVDRVYFFISSNIQPLLAELDKIDKTITATNERLESEAQSIGQKAALRFAKNVKLELENIVTLSANKQTGAKTCRANLNVFSKGFSGIQHTIFYTLEITSKGELYATLTDIQ